METFRFDNWSDFVDFVRDFDETTWFARDRNPISRSFQGVSTYQDAIELADKGWTKQEGEARKISQPIIDLIGSYIERNDPVYDVEASDNIDIGAYLTGEPECVIHSVQTIVEGKSNRIFKIALNWSVSGGVGQDVISARGAVLAALAECLELGGYRVEITACIPAGRDDDLVFDCRVVVKSADQPLDMARVMYALAHPSTYRALGFNIITRINERGAHVLGLSFGQVIRNPEYASEYDIFIGGAHIHNVEWQSPESATAWIIQTLRDAGVQLHVE